MPSSWLWALALIATFNPLFVALALPRRETRQDRATLAAVGGALGSLVILVAALFSGSPDELRALNQQLAARDGPIVPVYVAPYPVEFLGAEVSHSVNTAAAGGNASLMTIG